MQIDTRNPPSSPVIPQGSTPDDRIAAIGYYRRAEIRLGRLGPGKALRDTPSVRYVDQASPMLAQACGAGTSLGKVKIKHFRNTDTGQEEYARFILVDTFVSRYTRGDARFEGCRVRTAVRLPR